MTICHGSMIYLVYPFILGRTIKTGLSESPLFPLFHGSFGELMTPNWLLALVWATSSSRYIREINLSIPMIVLVIISIYYPIKIQV